MKIKTQDDHRRWRRPASNERSDETSAGTVRNERCYKVQSRRMKQATQHEPTGITTLSFSYGDGDEPTSRPSPSRSVRGREPLTPSPSQGEIQRGSAGDACQRAGRTFVNPGDVGLHSLRGPRLQHQLGSNRAMVDGEPFVPRARTAVLLARGLATRADAGLKEGSIPKSRKRGDGIHTLFPKKRTP